MRVFLDTNVLVSATATRGLCADLFREVLLSHHLVVSRPLLDELARALGLKFGAGPEIVEDVLCLLQQDTTVATGAALPEVALGDKDDLVILAGAIAGGAEVFVTGDKAVQALRRVGKMQALSPRPFWERLVGQQPAGADPAGPGPAQP
jgi:putative PIN family toxin of toxin-antitoxin system